MHRRAFAVAVSCAAIMLASAAAVRADVRLPTVFGDGMVLQRDVPIPVWGWADPGEEVVVVLSAEANGAAGKSGRSEGPVTLPLGTSGSGPGDSITAPVVTDAEGRWRVELRPVPATGIPLLLKVSGRNSILVKNVLVGDVWFCSGQSNMYWPVRNSANAKEEMAAADWPQIRLFEVAKDAAARPREDVYGSWRVCSPQTVGGFSAAAYYFARRLHQELNVPIGLIHASWAASSAHPWTSAEGLAADPKVKAFAESLMKQTGPSLEKFAQEFEPQWAEWAKAAAQARADGKQPPARPEVSFKHDVRHVPSALFNGMVAPLARMPVKGVIWYQGENDAHRGMFYQSIFESLIRDWRTQWKQEEMPFLFVQLASHMARQPQPSESKWAELRAAQAAATRLPHTAMACAIDIGEADNIHPSNKQDVGLRLALGALHVAYGKDLVYSGPVLKSWKADGGTAVLRFDHVGGGLEVRGERLTGFAVAGPDKKFVWAEATVKGGTVIVTSDSVSDVRAVRYAWADNPECNLYNKERLPAVPFRTDE
ncbi:MAG: sialate O-acetylesterase [Phycisphaerae bacterium]|nr:sialate O-acetylesterase [Phycisphaerae bacterium]